MENLCFIRDDIVQQKRGKKREEKGGKAKKILAGSRPAHVHSVVSLEVKQNTLHITVFVIVLCFSY